LTGMSWSLLKGTQGFYIHAVCVLHPLCGSFMIYFLWWYTCALFIRFFYKICSSLVSNELPMYEWMISNVNTERLPDNDDILSECKCLLIVCCVCWCLAKKPSFWLKETEKAFLCHLDPKKCINFLSTSVFRGIS
jgi:hypothetical protein